MRRLLDNPPGIILCAPFAVMVAFLLSLPIMHYLRGLS
jgi:hypothetical protein